MAKILLIDDDVDLVEVYGVMLRQKGHEVAVAYSAAEAREVLAQVRPELVILDVMMETVSAGFELGQEIHARDKDLPLLFVSSIVKDIHESVGVPNVFESDASWLKTIRFLDKPLEAQHLLREVETMLAQNQT